MSDINDFLKNHPSNPMNEHKTLRDSFAEHALQGLLAYGWSGYEAVSEAYILAENMLRVRQERDI